MIIRIKQFKPIENYCLDVTFDGGKRVIYDMKDDIETLPGYSELKRCGVFFHRPGWMKAVHVFIGTMR